MLKKPVTTNPLFTLIRFPTIKGYSGYSYCTRKFIIKTNKYSGASHNFHFNDMGFRICLKKVPGPFNKENK